MARPRVLYVSHGHPDFNPGGTEIYSIELFNAVRARGEFEPFLLARIDPQQVGPERARPWDRIAASEDDPHQLLFEVAPGEVDYFFNSLRDKTLATQHYRELLQALRPDVVHFQHTIHLGYDLLRETRALLPKTAIVYTLHEFLPICHRDGQMIRTRTDALCERASYRQCHACFPEHSTADFFLRKRFIQSQLGLVDLLLSPSHFLRERFIEWGIPADRILFEENGRRPLAKTTTRESPHNRLGFFGRLGRNKGPDVLLRALRILAEDKSCPAIEARFYGNSEPWPEFDHAVADFPANHRCQIWVGGQYRPGDQAGLLAETDWVVVPSIWWENSPLVIQEAFQAGRPVICADIGGMAEKVADGVSGLHFRARDPFSLAQVIRRAVATSGLWEKLAAGVPPVYRIDDAAAKMAQIYRGLLNRRAVK